jgi:hypothetical protein
VTFTANVSPVVGTAFPIGQVQFLDGTTLLGTASLDGRGQAKLTLTTLSAGTHVVTASYVGCSTCLGSTSAAVNVKGPSGTLVSTTITLNASIAAPVFGQIQTLKAQTSAPGNVPLTGVVDFYDGTNLLGAATLSPSGVATLSVSSNLGTHKLSAQYLGSSTAAGSTSAPLYEVVAKSPTTVLLSLAPDGSSVVAQVRPAFTGSPIGTVTFMNGQTVLGTASVNGSGVATLKLPSPTTVKYQITAVYGGSSCFLGSTSNVLATT